jgi:hypothetical protein
MGKLQRLKRVDNVELLSISPNWRNPAKALQDEYIYQVGYKECLYCDWNSHRCYIENCHGCVEWVSEEEWELREEL